MVQHELASECLALLQLADEGRGALLLDVGCGGGILSESLARAGATVTGIDMAEAPLSVARLHALDAASRRHFGAAYSHPGGS